MELTLTGASLNSDTTAANVSSNANHNHNHNHTTNDDRNALLNGNSAATTTTATCPDPNHRACCHQSHPPKNQFKQLESIPMERLIANPGELFMAMTSVIRHGPFETFRYLADAVLQHENEKGAPMEWGTRIDSNNISRSSLFNRSGEGHTLCHWAAKRGNDIRFIEYLSRVEDANLHVASTDNVGMYPIHWAATEGSIPNVALILKHSNSTSGYATTSSSSAHHHHRLNSHHKSSNIDPNDPINARDNSECTPLLIAAQYGHGDLAAFLIKRGADPNAVDKSNDTALHWAAYKGAVPVCGLLLHLNGIENHLDLQDAFGQSPLHLASLRGNVDVVQYLMDSAEGYVDRNMDRMDVSLSSNNSTSTSTSTNTNTGTNNKLESSSSSPPTAPPAIDSIHQYPRRLLLAIDKDGCTPLDLAIKKNKIACQVVLREYMDSHCSPDLSLWGRIKNNVKPFCSCTNWKTWMGITPDHGHVKQSPRLVFWLVVFNVNLAVILELFVYAPFSFRYGIGGRLSDSVYLPLHLATMFFQFLTYASMVLVNRTDPGVLSVTGFTASNTVSTSYFGAFLNRISAFLCGLLSALPCISNTARGESSVFCANENGRIKRETQNLTRELRDEYEETLERFATEDQLVGKESSLPSLCHSCHIAKPLRSKHCRILNQCVLLFDHHCPFVGTTIGLYNYKYFYLFVFSATVGEILLGITGILHLRRGMNYTVLFVAIYIAVYGCLTSGLCFYHTQLIARNLTTNEHSNIFRLSYLNWDSSTRTLSNPFDKGFVQNLIGRLRPWKGSYMLAYCNMDRREAMELNDMSGTKKLDREPKKVEDDDESVDLMLNVV